MADCAGNQTETQLAIDVARTAITGSRGKGQIALITVWGTPITLNFDKVAMSQSDLHGGWSLNGPEIWEKAVKFLVRDIFNYKSMIASRYKLEDWELGFAKLCTKKGVEVFIPPNATDRVF